MTVSCMYKDQGANILLPQYRIVLTFCSSDGVVIRNVHRERERERGWLVLETIWCCYGA